MFKKSIPILGFILITLIFSWQFLFKGLLPVPADTIVGLYYPYRDIYKETNPNGIPFKNFLITDPVRQQYPWRTLTVESFNNTTIPTWNSYSLSGTPSLANFQSAAFYPFNIMFFIFPFNLSWSFLVLLQPLLAGVFLYLYLRNLKLDEYSSFFGGVVFAFSGFSAMWLEWGTVLQTALWLPLILLSTDKIFGFFESKKVKIKDKRLFLWSVVLLSSVSFSFFAGHLQTFFYLIIFSFIYSILKIWKSKNRTKLSLIYLTSFIISVIIILPQLIPTIKFIGLSARDLDQANWQQEGWFLPLKHLVQFASPDFFGNPTTLNYWGTWNYGELTAFIGIPALILSLFAMFFVRDKKTLFFMIALFTALIFSVYNPISKIPFLLNIPFISTTQPTRLIFIIDFSLSVLAAFGLNYLILKGKLKQILIPIGLVGIVLVSLLMFVQLNLGNFEELNNLLVARRNLILPILIFILSSILLISISLSKKKFKNFLVLGLIFLTIFELFRFSWKFNTFAKAEYLYPETKSISYIRENIVNYRIATSDPRIMAPNFSIMHNISSVEGYDPLFLNRYAKFVSAINRGRPDISAPYGFNRIIRVENLDSNLVDLMGVKYVLSLDELNLRGFNEVLMDGTTRVYENEDVIPRAFFVNSVIPADDEIQAIRLLFDPEIDLREQAVVEVGDVSGEYSQGEVEIIKYSNDKITLKTKNDSEGFLVLTDSYYPTWHAKINGKEAEIYITNFNFRGVVVPAGENTVEFINSLL